MTAVLVALAVWGAASVACPAAVIGAIRVRERQVPVGR